MRQRDVNQECEYCHDDLSKRLCVWCRDETRVKLEYLARNLAVAGALCEAWELGYVSYPTGDACKQTPSERCIDPDGWAPGIRQPAPRGWIP